MNIVLLMFALPVLAQSGGTVTVSGVVTSAEDKYPLIGAHVIAGDNNGVSTLLDGSYSIDVKPGDVLTYYYVGYEEVKYTVPDGAASIKHNVELKAETKSLEDVVVIAYGVRKKGTIAGSVSTVKAEKIENTMLNYQGIEQADEGSYTLVTPISAARFMLPYWTPYRPDGSIASIDDGTWKGDGQNPLEWLEKNRREYKKYKLVSNIFAEATPVEGLTIRSQFSIDYSHMTGFGTSTPSYGPNLGEGSAQRISTDGMSLSVTNTVNYQFRKGDKHSFNFLVGQEGVDYHYEDFSILTEGQNNDRLVNISTGTRASSWSDTTDDYGYLSFFGRGEYNYDNRYYADFSVRTDASSRFGADRRWAGFWYVSFMWNLRQERFMDNASRWLTNAQIAVSTGTSGNSSIPNYEHLALVSGGSDYFGNAGIAPSQPGSDNLGWEKLWTTNLAFHLGFWNRLNVDLEFYNKRTSDMLMLVPESYANKGYGYSWDNIGVMVNRGFELNVTGTIFSNRNFMWSVNANVSYNRNRILELYNGVQEYEMSQTAIEGEDGAYQIMVNGLFTEENIDGGVGIIDFYDANIDNTEDPGNNAHNRYCVTMPAFRDLVKHDANNAVFAFNAEGQYSSTTAGTEVVDDYATAGVSSTAGLKFFVLMQGVQDVINPQNFPKLHVLRLANNQRRLIYDLSNNIATNFGGFYDETAHNGEQFGPFPSRLLKWTADEANGVTGLDTLVLSVNYFQGSIPSFEDDNTVGYYTEHDIINSADTLPRKMLTVKRVMPQLKMFAINLNRLTGPLPEWLLYHPSLDWWDPGTLIFTQEGKDELGNLAGFSNLPANLNYYYEVYTKKQAGVVGGDDTASSGK